MRHEHSAFSILLQESKAEAPIAAPAAAVPDPDDMHPQTPPRVPLPDHDPPEDPVLHLALET